MRKLLLLLTLGLVGIILVPVIPTFADEGDIEVLDAEAESQFPDGIKFSVTAQSSEEIDEIRVFFKKVGQKGLSAYRSVDFEPGKLVTGESILSSGGGSDYFPPGTRIQFSFEIRDKAGAALRTTEQDFLYNDNRFEWLSVSSDLTTVYYYGEYVEQRALTVLDAAESAMEIMVPILGIEPTEPLRIVSYNNYRHMSTALPFRSQAVREQLQTQGLAFVDERVLLVHGFDATVRGTVSHEFTHLLVAEAGGRAYSQVPAWLNEGLAEYGNIDPTDSYEAALRYGIYTRRLKPLWFQQTFTGTPDDIIIAYGQGRSVVNFLINNFPPGKMAELFRTLQETLDIDLALEQVYGFDQYGLDTAWRNAVGLEPLPPPGELERQLQDAAEAPADEATEPTLVATGPLVSEPTPTPEPSPVASLEDEGGPASSSGGCSAPSHSGTGFGPAALGTFLLMGAPLGLLSFQAIRRRRTESTSKNGSLRRVSLFQNIFARPAP